MDTALDRIRNDIEMRATSDRTISNAWLGAPTMYILLVFSFLFYVVMGAITTTANATPGTTPSPSQGNPAAGILAAASTFLYLNYAILFVASAMFYRLIENRNDHFRREHALFDDLLSEVKEQAEARGLSLAIQPTLASAEDTLKEIKAKETQRPALLWVVSGFFIGVILMAVVYFLTKDYGRHERRGEMFLEKLSLAASSIGLDLGFQRRFDLLPNRSFALYAVLTIVTCGVFSVYWLYRIISDPRRHFASQWGIEDAILGRLAAASFPRELER